MVPLVAGACTAIKCAVMTGKKPEQEEEESDAESEPGNGLQNKEVMPDAPQLQPANAPLKYGSLRRSITKLEKKIKRLKTTVEWLRVEKSLLSKQGGSSRRALKRQAQRKAELRKRIPGVKFSRQGLASSCDKHGSLLRIKEAQRKRKVQLLQRKQLHDRLEEKGPKALDNVGGVRGTCFDKRRYSSWQSSGGVCGE